MSAVKEIKRGSRAWFNNKLKAIEALGGEDARALAVKKWGETSPYGATDLDHIERVLKLRITGQKIQDRDATAAIEKIIQEGDEQRLAAIEELLSEKAIEAAINAQHLDEDSIRDKARTWGLLLNKTELSLRRTFRQQAKQGVARINMALGLVGGNGHHHVTPHELDLRNEQKARWRKFGESTTLTRGDEEINMLDVMKSAGKKKFAEIYTLTKGLESYAKAAGLSWAFITLTAPPRMHPNPENGKSSWDGTTPDMAHSWIHNAYKKAESRLRKQKIIISGLRVVEPHKDGAPHWHALIFAHTDDMATIEAAFRQQPEWKPEAGLKFVLGDGRATAASYCFKYLTKTINSVDKLAGEEGSVDAWRSTWGIHAFEWFGMPALRLWRNLRAVKECPAEPLLAGLWRAAHRGDGHAFIGLAGGLNVKSKDRPVVSRTIGDKYDKTKTIEFILQETAASIKFDFVKWQQSRASVRVEVIPNHPRRSKAHPSLTRLRLAPLLVERQGMMPCTSVRGKDASFAASFTPRHTPIFPM